MTGYEEFERSQGLGNVGDNKEFVVASISTITVHFNDSTNTSANDTATNLYFDHNAQRHSIVIRPDKTIAISKINGVALTDPITVTSNGYTERFWGGGFNSLEIQVQSTNTDIKIRCI